MNLTDKDKERLFILALVVLGIIITLVTDSCGMPTPEVAVTPSVIAEPVRAVIDDGAVEYHWQVVEGFNCNTAAMFYYDNHGRRTYNGCFAIYCAGITGMIDCR